MLKAILTSWAVECSRVSGCSSAGMAALLKDAQSHFVVMSGFALRSTTERVFKQWRHEAEDSRFFPA
jgi:hypothetical protein